MLYHQDNNAAASALKTQVKYGTLTKTLTTSELGFAKDYHNFTGWRVYRTIDDTWYLKDSNGKNAFKKLVNGQLPAGHTYVLYKDGENVKQTASHGEVHLYGQWK